MKKIQLYGHFENEREPKLVEVDEAASVNELLAQIRKTFGNEDGSDTILLVEDEDAPLEKAMKINQAGIKNKAHVHVHRCAKVAVTIFYNGEDKTLLFPPSSTGKKIKSKAIKEFAIAEADSGDYLLKIDDATVFQPSDHLGSFISHPKCEITLYLTPLKPVQG